MFSYRWSSTFLMLERFKAHESDIKWLGSLFPDFELSDNEWSFIDKLVEALEPAKVVTTKLQKEDLIMSDFYRQWVLCKYTTGLRSTY